mgnify:CR=1 FL=1
MSKDASDRAEKLLGIAAALPDNTPIQLTAGELRRALSQSNDANTREALFFRQLMENVTDMVYFKDRKSRFIASNQPHALDMNLSSPAEVLGKSDFDFFKKDSAQSKFAVEQKIIKENEGVASKEHHFKTDGSERWVLSNKYPWTDEEGHVMGTFGISRDITQQTIAEQALSKQHHLIDTLLYVLPCRIWIRDRNHRFKFINEEYRKDLGLKDESQALGRQLNDFIEHDLLKVIKAEDTHIMETGVPVINRVEYDLSPINKSRWVSISKVPLYNSEGLIEGIVGVTFDITAQKEAEAQATATGKELEIKNTQMEQELSLARKMQQTLATARFPQIFASNPQSQIHAAYIYQPSEHLSGDFFLLSPIDETHFGVFICDVMGHGVRSALVTVVIRGLLEEQRSELSKPTALFERLNKVLSRLAQDPDFPRFVTAAYAYFDIEKRTVEVVSAGHIPIIALSPNNPEQQILVHDPDPALGMIEDVTFHTTLSAIYPNSLYILSTDGLLEQENKAGEPFGFDRILEAVRPQNRKIDANASLKSLEQALQAHAEDLPITDDICAVGVSIH